MYENLRLNSHPDRPTFYCNFVQTLDGKVAVPGKPEYWPIGSTTDYATLIQLRAHADALIHGKTTAISHPTKVSLSKPEFQELRKQVSKTKPITYVVVSDHPDAQVIESLQGNPEAFTGLVVTNRQAQVPDNELSVARIGRDTVDLHELSQELWRLGCSSVLVEGGPGLLASFFNAGLIDEIFLTIAPKVYGGNQETTLSMTEGELLEPKDIARFQLIETHQAEDELFLHYRRRV